MRGGANLGATPHWPDRQDSMKTRIVWLAPIVALFLLSGCAQQEPTYVEPQTDAEAIKYWLDQARGSSPSVSDEQIAVLERALERGTVARADVNEVMPAYLDCLDAAGLTYYVDEEEAVPGSGVSTPRVSVKMVGSDQAEWDRLAGLQESCASEHEIYIASAYVNQPTSLQAQDAVWTGAEMRACLTEHGFTVEDDATAAQIRMLWDDDITKNIDNADFTLC